MGPLPVVKMKESFITPFYGVQIKSTKDYEKKVEKVEGLFINLKVLPVVQIILYCLTIK